MGRHAQAARRGRDKARACAFPGHDLAFSGASPALLTWSGGTGWALARCQYEWYTDGTYDGTKETTGQAETGTATDGIPGDPPNSGRGRVRFENPGLVTEWSAWSDWQL